MCSFFAVAVASAQSELLNRFDRADGKEKIDAANQFFDRFINAEEISDRPINFTEAVHPDTLRQQVYYWAAEYFYARQQWAEAEKYAARALPLCQKGENRSIESDCLSILSLICVRQGDFKNAAEYAKQCNKIDLKSGNDDNISSSFNTLAGIYMGARQLKEAEKYILKAIEYCQKADNPQRRAVIFGMASEIYHALGNEQQSYDYARKAFDMENALGRTEKALIREAQMASALMGLNRYDEAKTHLQRIIPAFRQNGNRHSLGISCNRMGTILLEEDN